LSAAPFALGSSIILDPGAFYLSDVQRMKVAPRAMVELELVVEEEFEKRDIRKLRKWTGLPI
jgi:hypothetical protein